MTNELDELLPEVRQFTSEEEETRWAAMQERSKDTRLNVFDLIDKKQEYHQ